jgi:hypothetical protein
MNISMHLCANLGLIPGFNALLHNNTNSSNILKLNNIESRTSTNKSYKVIQYDKSLLSSDLVTSYGLCRSVIANEEGQIVCFAPPKSITADAFMKKYPVRTDNLIAEEFIEGTMINVFWDSKIGLTGAWEISTRNTVGATSSFYKHSDAKTFRTMFLEAAKENNLILELLNPLYCYSFVLQHPLNRIVVPFKSTKLYLVSMYIINNVDMNDIKVYRINMNDVRNMIWFNANINFPEVYSWESYTELITKYASMNTPYTILGVVIVHASTGERTKIRNPVYEEVRSLRGNHPKLQYQYISLRKDGKVRDFLKFYPENKNVFSRFRYQIHLFANTLFDNYISCYVKKQNPLSDFPHQYKIHMFNLHKTYLTKLRDAKMCVTNTVVIHYVNELHPSLLMYCLNYNMRKRNLDFIVSDSNV